MYTPALQMIFFFVHNHWVNRKQPQQQQQKRTVSYSRCTLICQQTFNIRDQSAAAEAASFLRSTFPFVSEPCTATAPLKDSWQEPWQLVKVSLPSVAPLAHVMRENTMTGEKSTSGGCFFSAAVWSFRGTSCLWVLNEQFVYVPPVCKSLSASKSYFLPAHTTMGGSCQCANMTRIHQPDNVFLCRGDDSGSWVLTALT